MNPGNLREAESERTAKDLLLPASPLKLYPRGEKHIP